MKVVSLCSGCGGLDLGLEKAGHHVVMQCESDEHCQMVLKLRFPGKLLVPDICGIQALPRGVDLVACGFPCIDVSTAGKREGIYGQHSGLWIHVIRLLRSAEDRVPWVLLENVPGLLTSSRREAPGIEAVAREFEQLGYSFCWRVIDAAAWGVPCRRKRVFFLASLHGDPRDVLLSSGIMSCLGGCLGGDLIDDQVDQDQEEVRPFHDTLPCVSCYCRAPSSSDFVVNLSRPATTQVGIVPCLTASNIDSLCAVLPSKGALGKLTLECAEKLQGFPEGFTDFTLSVLAKGVRGGVKGARARMIGNAVSVHVSRWIGEALMCPQAKKFVLTDIDIPLDEALSDFELTDEEADTAAAARSHSWPASGWFIQNYPGGIHATECSEFPVSYPLEHLGSVLTLDPGCCMKRLKRELRIYCEKLSAAGRQCTDVLINALSTCDSSIHAATTQSRADGAFIRVGVLVWAKIKKHAWWPGEAFDLSTYSPQELTQLLPYHLIESHLLAGRKTEVSGREKRLLVCFFGDQTFAWMSHDKLLRYEEARSTMVEDALDYRGSLPPKLADALKEADSAQVLQSFQRGETDDHGELVKLRSAPDLDFIRVRYSKSGRSAQLASFASKAPRCDNCSTCKGSALRACLRNRAWAHAAAGHAGKRCFQLL